MKIMFIISSRFGYTRKMAFFIAEEIKKVNIQHEIDYFDLECSNLNYNFTPYDLIIIGASIRYGHFHKNLLLLTQKYATILNSKKTAFYAVNLVARKPNKNKPENNIYTHKFLQKSSWEPGVVRVFAGELNYPRYNFLDKQFIRLIMRLTGGDTDTRKKIEYTDWSLVKQFARELLAF